MGRYLLPKMMLDYDLNELAKKAQSINSAEAKSALNQLLSEVNRMVEPIVKKKLLHANQHEDCIQEILIAVHGALHTYDPAKNFKPWLNAICSHKMIDHIRAQYHRDKRELFDTEAIDRAEQPTTQDQQSSLGEAALQVLSSLPETYREAVTLVKVDGLSTREAAKKLGITESAFKVRASRGYKMIKKKMEGLKDDNG